MGWWSRLKFKEALKAAALAVIEYIKSKVRR